MVGKAQRSCANRWKVIEAYYNLKAIDGEKEAFPTVP
jgi:hypothetical protein